MCLEAHICIHISKIENDQSIYLGYGLIVDIYFQIVNFHSIYNGVVVVFFKKHKKFKINEAQHERIKYSIGFRV